MNHQASGIGSDLEVLRAQVQDLERRVAALEKEKQSASGLAAPSATTTRPETLQIDLTAPASPLSVVSILGRAVLGMAGAYLLRAAVESEVIPKLAVVVAALVYAWVWQFFSVRAGKSSRTAEAIYGITAALILFPMLWESTLRFQILPARVTGAILFGSVLSAMILERRRQSPATLWAAVIFSSATGLGLFVATRDPLPFVLALMLTFAVTEVAACMGRWLGLRIAAAIALNLALCALLYLAAQPEGFPSEYRPIRVPVLLSLFAAAVVISTGTAEFRVIRLRRTIAWQEILQMIVSFALLLAAVAELAGSTAIKTFGAFCFLASAAYYFGAYFGKEKQESSRDFWFYATCAAALFLIASYSCLPAPARVPWFSFSAILSTALTRKAKGVALAFHGFIWLMAVEVSSGAITHAGDAFVGGFPVAAPGLAWMLAMSAAVCSLIVSLRLGEAGGIHVLRYCSVANASFLLGAFSVAGIVAILPGGSLASAARLSFLRTFLICAMALVLALMGSRWSRRELVWVAYTAIGLGTVKLLLEDLRLGSTGSFALSLLAYGVLLAVIPRLVRGDNRGRENQIRSRV